MTEVLFLRSPVLQELRGEIGNNLERYRDGDFNYLLSDPSLTLRSSIKLDSDMLNMLKQPSGSGELFDDENSIIFYNGVTGITPYEARDERLWAFLTHTHMLDYTRHRWPIPSDDDEAIKHIQKHFFAKEKRQIERDNSVSRLWWMAHLCFRIPELPHEDAIKAFLYRTDVRANIIERPTTSQTIPLFRALLLKLIASYGGGKVLFQRAVFRKLMVEINLIGGYKLLDALTHANAESLLSEILESKIGVTEL